MIDPDLLIQTIENADQGIYLAAPDGSLLFVNRRFAELVGSEEEDLFRRSLDELRLTGRSGGDYQGLIEAVRDGERVQRSITLREGTERAVPALEIIAPVYRNGAVVAILGSIASDAPQSGTDDVLTGTDTALFVLEGLPEAVRYRSVSASFASLAGTDATGITGRTPGEVWDGPGPSRLLENVERSLTREGPVTFTETYRTGGRDLVLETTLRRVIRPNREPLVIGSCRDCTEQRRIEEELRFLTEHDSLTNEPNRATISEELDRELSRSIRHGRPFSILLVNVDRLKTINDDYGHETGDAALRGIVATVHAALRPSDRLGRWGGDEFLIILPETTRDGAMTAAERIRVAVENAAIVAERVLTVSVGIAAVGPADPSRAAGLAHSSDSLIRIADEEVQRAKEEGRNRVSG
jgi:diguanylate cyclase (GGDEF)-like protein/PAS domain S-box-containing protein